MNNILQTALAEAVNSLANFFGTTMEAIIEHAPEFLAKYGWYDTLHDIPLVVVIAVLLTFGVVFLVNCIMEVDIRHPILFASFVFIFCLTLCIGINIIPCVVAPEMVGAHAVLELFKSMQ